MAFAAQLFAEGFVLVHAASCAERAESDRASVDASDTQLRCYSYIFGDSGRGVAENHCDADALAAVTCGEGVTSCIKTSQYKMQRKHKLTGSCDVSGLCKGSSGSTTIESSSILEKDATVHCCEGNFCNGARSLQWAGIIPALLALPFLASF
eukprot:TRINITY_DN75083_c0_g1_i1.p1 TRINITY_DN75083_c0_g1~~TRINITY_DN75083_c0_g1_i1.p1  ORF type:complete len:162 (+),score=19.74 TRINITY_DN75083_c0_g1_i1:32-487(+)